ncbi:GumC family protein [Sulfurimonas xiamenensis]|uniref:non-specific protein-tyrosine kinase n=1 Tax=Sulfurimonas xiamenensis TaxID=2590021 RepID=A0AAJ4A3H2_9BACT|nr:polysaccharide biosynthesis tyrosine autokinase [Sulfurimonas xiamenensis]QFR43187.1 polysaccharide biosynthesis tyrosine autokinase [Sulfurimonas xiamenensis]
MSIETQNNVYIEDEIDLKQLFESLSERKLTIIFVFFITLAFGIAFAYFAQPIYKTSTTIQVKTNDKQLQTDMLQAAIQGMPNTEIDTELGILQSYTLIKEVLNNVVFDIRYFKKENFKTLEVFVDEAPFKVLYSYPENSEFIGRMFSIKPLDTDTFELSTLDSWKDITGLTQNPTYNAKHKYNEKIINEHFSITISKKRDFIDEEYFFSFNDKRSLIENMIKPNLFANIFMKNGSIVEISYEDNLPQRAQIFTNALANAYIQQNININTEEATKKLDFIEKQIVEIKSNLEKSAINVEQFKQKYDLMDIATQTQASMQKLIVYDQELAQIEIEEEQAKRVLELLETGDFSSLSIAPLQISDLLINSLMQALSEAERERRSLLVEFTERHPEVMKVTQNIAKIKNEILSNIKSLYQGIKNRRESIEKIIEKNEAYFKKLPEKEREYIDLMRKFQVNENMYAYLLEKQYEASIIKASKVSNSRIIDPALLPLKPLKPKISLIIAVSAVLGLILGIMIALIRNALDNTIKNYEDITNESKIPVIGSIPFIKGYKDTYHVIHNDPKSVYAESFRAIRTNLQFMATYSSHKTIMISSTIPAEGKTTTSSNLGAILAMSDKKTIILNLDLRLPTLHKVFNLPNDSGMSNFLSGHTQPEEIIQNTEITNLDIISSGPVPPNPSELIMSERMEEIIEFLKQSYDYIILDTPPLGLVTDATILANLADITLLVVKSNYAKKGFVTNFEKTAKAHNIKNTGIILNALLRKKAYSGYGGYGGYGYGYEEKPKRSWFKHLLKI